MGFWSWVMIVVGLGAFALAVWGLIGLQLWRKSKRLTAQVATLAEIAATAEQNLLPAAAPPLADEPARSEWAAAARRQRSG